MWRLFGFARSSDSVRLLWSVDNVWGRAYFKKGRVVDQQRRAESRDSDLHGEWVVWDHLQVGGGGWKVPVPCRQGLSSQPLGTINPPRKGLIL